MYQKRELEVTSRDSPGISDQSPYIKSLHYKLEAAYVLCRGSVRCAESVADAMDGLDPDGIAGIVAEFPT